MGGALLRYRVIAWVTGVALVVLTVGVVLRYTDWLGTTTPVVSQTVSPVHGFGYVLYLAACLDLAVRRHWGVVRTVLVMLAGTVPFMSFVAERVVVRDVRELSKDPAGPARQGSSAHLGGRPQETS